MRKLRISVGYLVIACIITCILGLYRIQTPKDEVSILITNISYGNQIRSIFSALLICFGGGISVFLAKPDWEINKLFIYAFPVGVFSWICFSALVICIGLPYKIVTMMLIYALFWLITVRITKLKRSAIKRILTTEFWCSVCVMTGTVIILSSCVLPIFQSYDSYYFIDYFGLSIAQNAGLYEGSASMAMHTALGMAVLSAYNSFWQLDNTYLIQYCTMLSFLLIFWMSLREDKLFREYKNRKFVTAFIVLLVFTEPCVLQLMQWNISNAYYMVLLFLLYMELKSVMDSRCWTTGNRILVPIFLCAAAYLRTEAPLFISCIIIAMLTTEVKKKDIFIELVLPALASSSLLYFRLNILSGYELNGSLLSIDTILMMLGLYCLTAIAVALSGLSFLTKLFVLYFYLLVLAAAAAAGIVLWAINREVFVESLRVYWHNMTDVENFWGLSVGILLSLFLFQYSIRRAKNNFGNILCILLFLANVYLGPARAIVNVPPRIGYGDSFNRNFVSLLPLSWYVVVNGIGDFFQQEKSQI